LVLHSSKAELSVFTLGNETLEAFWFFWLACAAATASMFDV